MESGKNRVLLRLSFPFPGFSGCSDAGTTRLGSVLVWGRGVAAEKVSGAQLPGLAGSWRAPLNSQQGAGLAPEGWGA